MTIHPVTDAVAAAAVVVVAAAVAVVVAVVVVAAEAGDCRLVGSMWSLASYITAADACRPPGGRPT